MDVVFPYCAGLEVHKKQSTACRVFPDLTGQRVDGVMDVQDFGTFTIEFLALSDWLSQVGVTHVVIERTGEYWQPVSNLLEGTCTVFAVNAVHVTNVLGRKTAKTDARWWAKLMRY